MLFTSGAPADKTIAGLTLYVSYTGKGALEYTNARVLQRAPGQDTIQLAAYPNDPMLVVVLTQTDPSDYLRDIRMLPAGGICSANPLKRVTSASACTGSGNSYRPFSRDHASIIFNPDFLEGVKKYKVIRFMDWQRTNKSPFGASWADRPLPSNQFYTGDAGVPLEVCMIGSAWDV